METMRMATSSGDLSQKLLSFLLSHNCWHNEEGTEGTLMIHLCCDNAEVKVTARKGEHHHDGDGVYKYTDYTITSFDVTPWTEELCDE